MGGAGGGGCQPNTAGKLEVVVGEVFAGGRELVVGEVWEELLELEEEALAGFVSVRCHVEAQR